MIDFSEEEEDAIASFEAKVGKDAEEVGKLKIWHSEINNLLDEEGWISDKIIDAYAKLMSGRKPTRKPNSLKCYFFTSWFNVSFLKEHLNKGRFINGMRLIFVSLMTVLNKIMDMSLY